MRIESTDERQHLWENLLEATCENAKSKALDDAARYYCRMLGDVAGLEEIESAPSRSRRPMSRSTSTDGAPRSTRRVRGFRSGYRADQASVLQLGVSRVRSATRVQRRRHPSEQSCLKPEMRVLGELPLSV